MILAIIGSGMIQYAESSTQTIDYEKKPLTKEKFDELLNQLKESKADRKGPSMDGSKRYAISFTTLKLAEEFTQNIKQHKNISSDSLKSFLVAFIVADRIAKDPK